MNIFSRLPFLDGSKDEVEPQTDTKAERIAFHRQKVRNGPVKFKEMTSGQIRRAEQRQAKRRQKKAYRAEVRNHLEKQQLASRVRGHLQRAGYLPYHDGHEAGVREQIVSTQWIVQRFGQEVEVEGKRTGRVSWREADVVDAFLRAAQFYGSATGYELPRRRDFVPAISLAEDAA